MDMQRLCAEGALKGHLIECCAHWLAFKGQVDHGPLHRELMDNDISRRELVWIVFDKPKEIFEVHPILAINLQPHIDPVTTTSSRTTHRRINGHSRTLAMTWVT